MVGGGHSESMSRTDGEVGQSQRDIIWQGEGVIRRVRHILLFFFRHALRFTAALTYLSDLLALFMFTITTRESCCRQRELMAVIAYGETEDAE